MVNTEDPRGKIQIHDEAAKPKPNIHIFIQRSWRKATKVPSQSSQSSQSASPPHPGLLAGSGWGSARSSSLEVQSGEPLQAVCENMSLAAPGQALDISALLRAMASSRSSCSCCRSRFSRSRSTRSLSRLAHSSCCASLPSCRGEPGLRASNRLDSNHSNNHSNQPKQGPQQASRRTVLPHLSADASAVASVCFAFKTALNSC